VPRERSTAPSGLDVVDGERAGRDEDDKKLLDDRLCVKVSTSA
jgi:hypothetical protein